MSTLSQVGRGAVLLTSMALVACYIDVYATGKFPWQHAAAHETPATVPPPEFTSDHAVEQTQFVQTPATQEQRMFMAGSKSDVAASAIVVQTPAANGPDNPTPAPTPLFLSGSKSFSGQTTVLSGALNTPPANPQADQKAPSFMGGSKTIMLPTRLPESSTQPAAPPVSSDKMQFMSGFKSPGPSVMQGTSLPTLPQSVPPGTPPATYPQQPSTSNQSFRPNVSSQQAAPPANGAAATNANAPNQVPIFMSGSKSMGPAVMPMTPGPRVQTPTQIPAQGKPINNLPQQQTAPIKLPPLSPAGSY